MKTNTSETQNNVGKILEKVGLLPIQANRNPHYFSNRWCQRIGIARLLILKPRFVTYDEPVAADVSFRAQVAHLLQERQQKFLLINIFIADDSAVIKQISTRIYVMNLGETVEVESVRAPLLQPVHRHTRALNASITGSDTFKVPIPKICTYLRLELLTQSISSECLTKTVYSTAT